MISARLSRGRHNYIRNTWLHYIDELELLCIALGCDCYMMNVIKHNYPSLIQCLHFSHIGFCKVTLLLLLLQSLQNCYYYRLCYYCYCYYYYQIYHTTVLLNTLLQIFSSPGVVELTTQLLILANILWLPLCQINKFGLNTLPSKTVAIPYTCGLSRAFSGTVAGEHSFICGVTSDLYMLITMKNLKDAKT